MKKINRTLSLVLAATILFSVLVSLSNVAAQNGVPQGDGETHNSYMINDPSFFSFFQVYFYIFSLFFMLIGGFKPSK